VTLAEARLAEKALGTSAARLSSGGMKDVSFPKRVHFRSRSKCVCLVNSSPFPLQKGLRLRKSELEKKTMFLMTRAQVDSSQE
jgi:hypothetical protein